MVTREAAEEFTQGLGQVVGGSYRIIASAHMMGVPQALGLTTEEWVNQRLGGYVKLTIEDRREAAQALTRPEDEGGMGLSQRETADVLGVGAGTINRDLNPDVPNGTGKPQRKPPDQRPAKDDVPDGTESLNSFDVLATIATIEDDINFLHDHVKEITRPDDVATKLGRVIVQLEGLVQVLRNPSSGSAPDWVPFNE